MTQLSSFDFQSQLIVDLDHKTYCKWLFILIKDNKNSDKLYNKYKQQQTSMQSAASTRYNIDSKTNKFMEFISREMLKTNRNQQFQNSSSKNQQANYANQSQLQGQHSKSYADRQPLKIEDSRVEDRERYGHDYGIGDVYGATTYRHRRAASYVKASARAKHNDSSVGKLKKQTRENSLSFYEGLKSKYSRESKQSKQLQKQSRQRLATPNSNSSAGANEVSTRNGHTHKESTSQTVGLNENEDYEIEELHYEMVKMQQKTKNLQKAVEAATRVYY